MVARTHLLSLEDFLALPEEKPYLELIDGEVCRKPMGTGRHGHAQGTMYLLLRSHPATKHGAAFTELTMPFRAAGLPNARIPDVAYFRPGRPFPDPYPDGPADLAVEVRSPGQSVASLQRKLAFLRERGVGSTLLIDPEEETVYVHDGGREWRAGRGDTVIMPALDGFAFDVDELFHA